MRAEDDLYDVFREADMHAETCRKTTVETEVISSLLDPLPGQT